MTEISCPACGLRRNISDAWAGKSVPCASCGNPVRVPAVPAETSLPAADPTQDARPVDVLELVEGPDSEEDADWLLGHVPVGARREAGQLGRPRLLCEFSGGDAAGAVAGIVVSALVFLVGVALIALWFLFTGPQATPAGLLAPGFGLLFCVAGVSIFLAAWRGWGFRGVLLCEEGFVPVRKGEAAVWRWADVEEVWLRITEINSHLAGAPVSRTTTYRCTVRKGGGMEFVFTNDFTRVDRAVKMVARETYARLLADALRRYNAGQSVDFDVVRVTKRALRAGGKSLLWADVQRVTLRAGKITVEAKTGGRDWFQADVEELPNALVLLGLTDTILGNEPSFEDCYDEVRFVGHQAVG
jgi:hypothetical protein